MNRKVTPALIATVLILGIAAFLTREKRLGGATAPAGARILTLAIPDVQEVRVQRDFWNSFTLTRQADGLWRLTEPVDEAAAPDAARRLLDQLAGLAPFESIDLPSDDSERHREYGLWQPELELVVSTADERHVLLVGAQTASGENYYATVVGRDAVHTISAAAVEVLGAALTSYRTEAQMAEAPGDADG